jgi:hypothetical protein
MYLNEKLKDMERFHHVMMTHVVNPAEFSLVRLPLWGPGLGFSPAASELRILMVVSGVRSS